MLKMYEVQRHTGHLLLSPRKKPLVPLVAELFSLFFTLS